MPMALLRHELPQGISHFDWLFAVSEVPGDDDRSVICLRTATPPWPAPIPGAILTLERAADHRGVYLRLAAPRQLEGRGVAYPVIRGTWQPVGDPASLRVQLQWSDGSRSAWQFASRLTQATCLGLLP